MVLDYGLDEFVIERLIVKKSVLILFAIASGFAVGNLYFIQPLLDIIAGDLGTTATENGWLVTAVQIGYALGIITWLPLGDVRSRKHLVPIMVTVAGLSQVAIGLSNAYLPLMVALFAVGFTTISGQILVPLTGELSDDSNRGKNVSFVVSGMIIGILGARVVSGGLADLLSWHATFIVIGGANLVTAIALYWVIPVLPAKPKVAYRNLAAGTFTLLRANPSVFGAMAINGLSMLIFSIVWTAITFLLSGPKFGLSAGAIGAWGLFGVVGALAARNAGRLIDKGKGDLASKVGWVLVAVSLVIGSFAEQSLVYLAIQLIVMDAAMQGIGVTNQTKLISMFPESRSRVNAGYVTVNFIGAAIGSAVASALWPSTGWSGLMLICAGISIAALGLWIWNRKYLNRIAAASPVGR